MIPITSRRGTRSRITASITDLVVYSATVHRFLFYDIWAEGEKRSSQLNDAQGTGITEIEETFDSDDSTCDSKKVGQKVDRLQYLTTLASYFGTVSNHRGRLPHHIETETRKSLRIFDSAVTKNYLILICHAELGNIVPIVGKAALDNIP